MRTKRPCKKLDEINQILDLLDSNVYDIEKKTEKYQNEVCDIKEIIESNDKLYHQMQSHINDLEQYSSRSIIRIFGIGKQSSEKTSRNDL